MIYTQNTESFVHYVTMLFSFYAKRDDFKFDIVNILSLDGDCPCSLSYGE